MDRDIATQCQCYVREVVRAKVPADDVEDVVQTALLSCVEAGLLAGDLDEPPSWNTVVTITKRRIADYHRRRRPQHQLPGELESPDYADDVEARDHRRLIRQRVAELKTPYRDVIEKLYFRDYSLRQIAEEAATALETIRTRHKRAKRALWQSLQSLT